ncbi:alpha/beta hydrolase [Amycolatopsis sp. RTGN1]|uniref:alpha/beta hydrolase n=1 Tax=Amycolatopsis ponsaeliensis TaxID=2992142 RepID=UPI00254FF55C|nr:alpha/beta fold hydrolase [Amycolatopsis sp. RTGN1]
MIETRTTIACDNEQLSVVRTSSGKRDAPCVVLLHGAGQANKERTLPLARDLAGAGVDTISFDFSGHGYSTGALEKLSLERRLRQARGVIENLTSDDVRLFLIGFSMSGQTVADLIQAYGSRVERIVLCSPAVYSRSAWPLAFGDGFTDAIRISDGWRDSSALENLSEFEGRAVLAVPGEDVVIPTAITHEIEQSLHRSADLICLTFGQASHQLGAWFAERPEARKMLIKALLTD